MFQRRPTFTSADTFETLYAKHYASVFSVVFGILGSVEDAEEATHDVLMKAHRALRVRAGEGPPPPLPSRAFLRTIARHQALDVRKRRLRARARDETYATDCVPIRSAERSLDNQVHARRVALALARFYPDDVALIERCLVQGQDRAAVASELGLTQNALNVRLHRALSRLRDVAASHD